MVQNIMGCDKCTLHWKVSFFYLYALLDIILLRVENKKLNY